VPARLRDRDRSAQGIEDRGRRELGSVALGDGAGARQPGRIPSTGHGRANDDADAISVGIAADTDIAAAVEHIGSTLTRLHGALPTPASRRCCACWMAFVDEAGDERDGGVERA